MEKKRKHYNRCRSVSNNKQRKLRERKKKTEGEKCKVLLKQETEIHYRDTILATGERRAAICEENSEKIRKRLKSDTKGERYGIHILRRGNRDQSKKERNVTKERISYMLRNCSEN